MSYQLLDLTLPTAVENIALDEALLESAEQRGGPLLLRVWEPASPVVVIGRGSAIESEVNLVYCEEQAIPVFRRCSGGASIVTAPGCLMYAVVVDYERFPELRMLENAHRYVMKRIQSALQSVGVQTAMNGTCDLTIGNRKFSGNAMRSKKNWMLYHGTLLCEMDLSLISRCLNMPDRQPDYREGRSHADFLTSLPLESDSIKRAIVNEFKADTRFEDWDREGLRQLVKTKYNSREWNYKR